MKKAIGIVCGLTMLSACSSLEFWKKDNPAQQVSGQRHAPVMNSGGAGAPPSIVALPVSAPDNSGYIPMPPPVSQNAAASMALSSNLSLPSNRRPPQFNSQNGVSGDLSSVAPSPQVMRVPLVPPAPVFSPQPSVEAMNSLPQAMPVPPAPVAIANIEPPVAPTMPVHPAGYPSLAQTPPNPPLPIGTQTDPRVQQMRSDLASMNQEKANIDKPQAIVKSVSNSSIAVPMDQAANQNAPLRVPADFQNLPHPQTNVPQMVAGGSPVPPAPEFTAPMPVYNAPHPVAGGGVKPNGPTIVVHSDHAPMQQQEQPEQVASLSAPAPQQYHQPMPAQLPSVSQPPMGYADIPQAAPVVPVSSAALPGSSTTSLASLHPIPLTPVGPGASSYPAADSADSGMPQSGYTNLADLHPIANSAPAPSGQQYRLLPQSRYAKIRESSNNNTYGSDSGY